MWQAGIGSPVRAEDGQAVDFKAVLPRGLSRGTHEAGGQLLCRAVGWRVARQAHGDVREVAREDALEQAAVAVAGLRVENARRRSLVRRYRLNEAANASEVLHEVLDELGLVDGIDVFE